MNEAENLIASKNHLWGEVVADFFYQNKIHHVFFSPGSRSTPLILALERKKGIECVPILDERTAAFVALGKSKFLGKPTALLCTSGSAPTHWFPAVTEAHYSSIPLLLLTADRPPELQNCGAGQTIDQVNLFEKFVRGFHQAPLPDSKANSIKKLETILQTAYLESLGQNPGPVQINFPFREPFFSPDKSPCFSKTDAKPMEVPHTDYKDSIRDVSALTKGHKKVLIIAGEFAPSGPVLSLLNKSPVPTLCDALSPLRHASFKTSILRYEQLIRNQSLRTKLQPELIITLGPLPTSKNLRSWIEQTKAERIIIEPRGVKVDPLVTPSHCFQLDYHSIEELELAEQNASWVQAWLEEEEHIEKKLQEQFKNESTLHEAKLVRTLSDILPDDAVLHVANSMPIRDLEWFWRKTSTNRQLFGNRGVNGIDGTLGTALGLGHESGKPTFLLTGELAFLHDSNALLFSDHFKGSLTVVLINNHGGGIFHHLPISQQPEFHKCFLTPQSCDFSKLCEAHGLEHHLIQTWQDFEKQIQVSFPQGIRILEFPVDREHSVSKRNYFLNI